VLAETQMFGKGMKKSTVHALPKSIFFWRKRGYTTGWINREKDLTIKRIDYDLKKKLKRRKK